ncbi:MAG TPA: phosphoribosylanthranilate isomerase [Alphaproteobacteria bacterium]|jgi:phosphoribosylanthranilate isomerase
MTVGAKICGINSRAALEAAVAGGAEFVGFIFYPPSPRYIAPEDAGQLARLVPPHIKKVGVFVDADPMEIDGVMLEAPLDVLQFHGTESPRNIDELRITFRLPAIKAIKIGAPADIEAARGFEGHADYLMFDAKPPADLRNALPGGNAVRFDWTLLAGTRWETPWFLSGGLTPENLPEAVRATGARLVDVSSGVEVRPGLKDPDKIAAFLKAAAAL